MAKQRVGIYSLETRVRKSGEKRYALSWWKKGHHHSKTFASDEDRKAWLKSQGREEKGVKSVRDAAARAGDYAARFSRLPLEVQHALLGAWDRLSRAGGTAEDVDRTAREAAQAMGGGITIRDAVAAHLEDAGKQRRARTMGNRRNYLRKLVEVFGDRPLCSLTRGVCRKWIEEAEAPGARRNRHAELSAFLNDCVRRDLLRDTPMRGLRKPPPPQTEDVDILTAEQAENVMRAAERICVHSVAYFALALFAGLRPERELRMLRVGHVNLEDGMIYVSRGTAKTWQNRSVPIPDNLRAWLKEYPPEEAVPYTRYWRNKVLGAAGARRSADILRHTCASFRLALTRDAARVADEMGHSVAVLSRHYANRRIPPADVERFWNIRPAEAPSPAPSPTPL